MILGLLRVHQWTKNLLIFAPVLLSHRYGEPQVIFASFLAFLSFSFAASFGYIVNDLVDVEHDKKHPTKKNRPIPRGLISKEKALLVAAVLILTSLSIASFLGLSFALIILLYLTLTLSYSFKFKKILLLDVVFLSLLYTIRILASHLSSEIAISSWLLTFSTFVFFSLACLKRSVELKNNEESKKREINGRRYRHSDVHIIDQIGLSSSIVSVLVFALYLNSPTVRGLYQTPYVLGAILPIFLYWISRLWILGNRGLIQDDPIVFVIKDKVSYIFGIYSTAIILLAR